MRICLFLAFLFGSLSAMARTYDYEMRWNEERPHTFFVKMTTQAQNADYTDFYINAWRPGRYILWNYSAGVITFEARNAKGSPLKWRKVNKDVWRVFHDNSVKDIEVNYSYYGFRDDAGGNIADDKVCYFNPVCFFMNVGKDYSAPCTLKVPDLKKSWKIASALKKTKEHNVFTAKDYHDFVDCPTIFAKELTQFESETDGFKFYVHFYGKYQVPKGEEKTFITNLGKIIKEQKAVFGEIPADEHHFIYFLSAKPIRHAVEHLRSSMYYMPETVAENEKSLGGLYSISSHEFWHVWNIKSLRPASLYPYDYTKEHHTGLHWFTEGVTDYYADLILARAGITTPESFLKDQAANIASMENSYAPRVISPEQSSSDSWLGTSEFYVHFLRTSFYPLGTRAALLIDFELMNMSQGKYTFDDVFRLLYKKYFKQNQGIPEDGVQQALEELTGKSWETFFEKYIRGTEKIDYQAFAQPAGLDVQITNDPNVPNNRLRPIGVSAIEKIPDGIYIRAVMPESDAQKAGIFDQSLILEIGGKPAGEAFNTLEIKEGNVLDMKVVSTTSEEEPKRIKVKCSGNNFVKAYAFQPNGKNELWKQLLSPRAK